MFNNVGKKIKTLSVIMFVILVIFSTLLAGIIAYLLISIKDEPMWILLGIFSFVFIETAGILISWLSVLKQYAFGELVYTNQIQVKQNNAIIQLLSGQDYSLETEEATPTPTVQKYRDEKYKRNYANNTFGAIDIPTDGEQGGANQ